MQDGKNKKMLLQCKRLWKNAIENVTGENIKLIGSSRTDAGVHARGYVCNFITESNIPP